MLTRYHFLKRHDIIILAATVLCSLLFAVPTFSETPEQLIKQLDSPQLQERNEAQQKLLELGPELEKFLPNEENLSAEAAIRLNNLRRQLLHREIERKIHSLSFTLDEQNSQTAKITVDWSQSTDTIRPIRFRFPLDAANANASFEIPVAPDQTQAPVRLPLKSLSFDGKSSVYHGKCEMLFAANPEEFVFPLLKDSDKIVRKENAVVSLESVIYEPPGRKLKVQFRVEYDQALDAMQSHQIWIENCPAFLRDTAGKAIFSDEAVRHVTKTDNRFEGILSFRVPRGQRWETLQFVYRPPTILAEKMVEFTCSEAGATQGNSKLETR